MQQLLIVHQWIAKGECRFRVSQAERRELVISSAAAGTSVSNVSTTSDGDNPSSQA
jgi:hypothetical protein